MGVVALGVRNLSHIKTKSRINSRMKNTIMNIIPRVEIHTSVRGSPIGYGGGNSALRLESSNWSREKRKKTEDKKIKKFEEQKNNNEKNNSSKKKKRKLTIATWNVQGWNNKDFEITEEIKKSNLDILITSETKKKGNGSEYVNGIVHLWSGVKKCQRAKAGVGILIKKKYERIIKNWEPVNERIIKLNLNIYGRDIVILGVYGPTDDSSIKEKDFFMQSLQEELNKIKSFQEIIIAGDLNGRVGRKEHDDTVGRFGEEFKNDNGERIINLCELTGLKITNGFYKHKEIHKFTWTQPSRQLKTIIDYIIVRKINKLKIKDVRVKRGMECGSDHNMLVALIEFPWVTNRNNTNLKGNKRKNEKFNLHLLNDQNIKEQFQIKLNEKLADNQSGTLSEIYEQMKESLLKSAEEVLGFKENARAYKIDLTEEAKIEIRTKKLLYKRWLSTKTEEARMEYKEKAREVRRISNKIKNEKWKEACLKIEEYIGGTRNQEAWKTIKALNNNRKDKVRIPFVPEDLWVHYYTGLLSEDRAEFLSEACNEVCLGEATGESMEISEEDVKQVILTSKNKKAAGPGNIPIELIKNGTEKLGKIIQNMFQRAINGEKIPDEWNEAYLTSIFKKGDRRLCENYRGISIISSVGRLYGKILKKKLESAIKGKIGDEQAGFTSGRSCIDHIYTIQQLLEKEKAMNKEVHLAFIDLKKAYDMVPRNKLWKAMEALKIPTVLINAVKHLYKNNKMHIKICDKIVGSIRTSKGLLQGCSTSPTLFKIYLEDTLKSWKCKCARMGIKVQDDYLYSLNFADDQVIIAQDKENLSYMVRKLNEAYLKAGMEINFKKTEYLAMCDNHTENLKLDENTSLRSCEQFKYLGFIISEAGSTEKEMNARIGQTRSCIRQLHPILWNNHITKNTKRMIYNTLIRSILTYGAENWIIHKKDQSKINAVEMEYWRRCCQLRRIDKVKNEDIRKMMDVDKNIMTYIEEKRLIWYGHVRRAKEDRWISKITDWSPDGKKRRGRPRRTFTDEVKEAMKKRKLEEGDWKNRREWRSRLREGIQCQL